MEIYYIITFFIFGTIFGSFFTVVGSRLPIGQSIINPPSHCTECGHRLKFYELIPILSFILQKGKCKKCKVKLSLKYPLYEFMTGILFALCYLFFGFHFNLILALTFISFLVIIMISDIDYYIISDEVILFFSILLLIEIFLFYGFHSFCFHLIGGFLSFILMYGVKMFGDFLFKKESMGGGDIKLMFIIGLVIGFRMSIITIVLSSFIGLPISLVILYTKRTNIIPFGPFLAIAAMILFFSQMNFNMIFSFLFGI